MDNEYINLEDNIKNVTVYNNKTFINNNINRYQYFNNSIPYNNDTKIAFNIKSKDITDFNVNVNKLYEKELSNRNLNITSSKPLNDKETINSLSNSFNFPTYNNINNECTKSDIKYTKSDIDPLNLLNSYTLNKKGLIEKYILLKNLYDPNKGGDISIYKNITKALYLLHSVK
tara:strand:- start:288 stop:806 length:519 start_codon:yes stop_codon:yes gene_type:complete